MILTNIPPHFVKNAAVSALKDFDKVTKQLEEEFENRKRTKTRRKYFLFGEKIEYKIPKWKFEWEYDFALILRSCNREDDKQLLETLRDSAKTAILTQSDMTLNEREWKLIKDHFCI